MLPLILTDLLIPILNFVSPVVTTSSMLQVISIRRKHGHHFCSAVSGSSGAVLPSHWGSPGRWSRAMCLSPSAAAGLGLTLTVCSGFGVAVPSADLGCDDLTTTCHLPPEICCCFLGCFFFLRNVSQCIFRNHLSYQPYLKISHLQLVQTLIISESRGIVE